MGQYIEHGLVLRELLLILIVQTHNAVLHAETCVLCSSGLTLLDKLLKNHLHLPTRMSPAASLRHISLHQFADISEISSDRIYPR